MNEFKCQIETTVWIVAFNSGVEWQILDDMSGNDEVQLRVWMTAWLA